MLKVRKATFALAVVIGTIGLTAGAAMAQTADSPAPSSPVAFNIGEPATYVPLIGGVLIPLVVSLLAAQAASGWIKSAIAALSAALIALGLYLTDTSHVLTWEGAGSAFVLALFMAAASRVTITGGLDSLIARKVPGGIG